MLSISLILALVLDRSFDQLQAMRTFRWLGRFYRWLAENWKIDRSGLWVSFAVLMLSLLLPALLLDGLFDGTKINLPELIFYVAVASLCLGPRSLDRDIDACLDSLNSNDETQITRAAAILNQGVDGPADESAMAGSIFILANRSLYTVIFWMALLGPVAALAYRLVERLAIQQDILDKPEWQARLMPLVAWIEWLPNLLTNLIFMLCGSFDGGLRAIRRYPLFDPDVVNTNRKRLQQTGLASADIESDGDAIDRLRKARGLVLRSLVVWLAVAAVIEYLS